MNLLDWIFPARHDAQVLEIARRVAEEQHDRVWQQLAARAGSLGSEAEAQGYIRCRSLRILRSGLHAILGPASELAPDLHERIIEETVDRVVGSFTRSMIHPVPAMASNQRAA